MFPVWGACATRCRHACQAAGTQAIMLARPQLDRVWHVCRTACACRQPAASAATGNRIETAEHARQGRARPLCICAFGVCGMQACRCISSSRVDPATLLDQPSCRLTGDSNCTAGTHQGLGQVRQQQQALTETAAAAAASMNRAGSSSSSNSKHWQSRQPRQQWQEALTKVLAGARNALPCKE